MEKKMKHRILGGMVIIGLGIILMPLLQTKSDLTAQVTVVKAPPFPDQAVQLSSADPKPLPPTEEQNVYHQSSNGINNQENEANKRPENIMDIARPSVVSNLPNEAITPSSEPQSVSASKEAELQTQLEKDELEVDQSIYSADEEERAPQVKMTKNDVPKVSSKIKKHAEHSNNTFAKLNHKKLISSHPQKEIVHMTRNKMPSLPKLSVNDNGLFDLSKAAWVIQLGSFKNKANALRLVNELRANGYHAFIQKISTSFGEHTQVFVGPENKRLSAHALANRLESEMHVKGIVISYQPLTL